MNVAEIENTLEQRGFEVVERVLATGRVRTDAVHPIDEMIVVLDGDVEIDVGGITRCPDPGEEVLLPAGTVHTIDNTGDAPASILIARAVV